MPTTPTPTATLTPTITGTVPVAPTPTAVGTPTPPVLQSASYYYYGDNNLVKSVVNGGIAEQYKIHQSTDTARTHKKPVATYAGYKY